MEQKQWALIRYEQVKRRGMGPDGRGIKKSAILENQETHAYYCEHSTSYRNARTWKRQRTKKRERKTALAQPLRIDPNRDVDRVSYRYLQLTKAEMVERLLIVEQAYAELAEQQARPQFARVELEQQSASRGKSK